MSPGKKKTQKEKEKERLRKKIKIREMKPKDWKKRLKKIEKRARKKGKTGKDWYEVDWEEEKERLEELKEEKMKEAQEEIGEEATGYRKEKWSVQTAWREWKEERTQDMIKRRKKFLKNQGKSTQEIKNDETLNKLKKYKKEKEKKLQKSGAGEVGEPTKVAAISPESRIPEKDKRYTIIKDSFNKHYTENKTKKEVFDEIRVETGINLSDSTFYKIINEDKEGSGEETSKPQQPANQPQIPQGEGEKEKIERAVDRLKGEPEGSSEGEKEKRVKKPTVSAGGTGGAGISSDILKLIIILIIIIIIIGVVLSSIRAI